MGSQEWRCQLCGFSYHVWDRAVNIQIPLICVKCLNENEVESKAYVAGWEKGANRKWQAD